MAIGNLDLQLDAFEAALPYLRSALPPMELSAWIKLHSREILDDAGDDLEYMYASSRIEGMLDAMAQPGQPYIDDAAGM